MKIIDSISRQLVEIGGKCEFSDLLSKEVTELNVKFRETTSLLLKHSAELKDGVDTIQTLLEKIRELERWTDDAIKKNTAGFLIQSNEDITEKQAKIKVNSVDNLLLNGQIFFGGDSSIFSVANKLTKDVLTRNVCSLMI